MEISHKARTELEAANVPESEMEAIVKLRDTLAKTKLRNVGMRCPITLSLEETRKVYDICEGDIDRVTSRYNTILRLAYEHNKKPTRHQIVSALISPDFMPNVP